MQIMGKGSKVIGTFVPMSALHSKKGTKGDRGTFAAGLIFLDWLKKTHQSAWQILPLYTTQLEEGSSARHVPSPYKSYGIGLDPKYMPKGFSTMKPTTTQIKDFIAANSEWIKDYALFCALRDHFGTDDWRKWDARIRNRNNEELRKWEKKLKGEVSQYITQQWRVRKSYELLRKKAKRLGIHLVGDLSFYLSIRSPLVWMYQDIFQIDGDGKMAFVSGAPGGPSVIFGRQVWGHPLYDWDGKGNRSKAINFWKTRLRYMGQLFDSIRFDHANGLFHYGAMDINNPDNDSYKDGPGAPVFKELMKYCAEIGVMCFAEDCGLDLKEIRVELNKLGISGVRILIYALNESGETINPDHAKIAGYPVESVAYTSTHDTYTLMGYLSKVNKSQQKMIAQATGADYDPDKRIFAINLREKVIESPSRIVIIPIQDWILSTERINVPGSEKAVGDTNWKYVLPVAIEDLPINLF